MLGDILVVVLDTGAIVMNVVSDNDDDDDDDDDSDSDRDNDDVIVGVVDVTDVLVTRNDGVILFGHDTNRPVKPQ